MPNVQNESKIEAVKTLFIGSPAGELVIGIYFPPEADSPLAKEIRIIRNLKYVL